MTTVDDDSARRTPANAGLRLAPGRLNARHWLVLFCTAYIVGALVLSPAAYVAVAGIYAAKLWTFNAILIFCGLLPAAVVRSPGQPLDFMIRLLRERGTTIALVIILFVMSLAAYTTYKLEIPHLVPFHGDATLADLDELLHGGAPWRYAHAISSDVSAMVVAVAYADLWFLQWFGMLTFAAFAAHRPLTLRYLWSLALTVAIVGTVLATLLSSAGPIYYEHFIGGPRFAGLIEALRDHPANEHVFFYSQYLLRNYLEDTTELGTGISAMPSMHVAIATLNALYLGRISRWLGAAGWLFALIILFGSVYTGWHYAVDGYVSVLVVTVIWLCTGKVLGRRAACSSDP